MSAIPSVVGFFTADEVPYSERKDGRWLNGFASTEAFKRVQAGYACGNCLAKFSMYMAVCPLCGLRRDVSADVEATPQDWQAFYDQHNYGSGATETRTMEDVLRDLHTSPDVEQIKMSKLKPSKHGRGRPG